MSKEERDGQLAAEIAAVNGIAAIPTILEVICRATGMGFAAIACVTEDRWIACSVKDEIGFGLQPGDELKVETTICHEIRQNLNPVVIDDVDQDDCYRGHPTPQIYGFKSYISYPISLPDGTFFGTLCAIDAKAARLENTAAVGMFKLFAELIAFHIDANDRVASSEARLLDERQTSELREQFIAVLGHDLRNPLAAISAGAELLAKAPLDAKPARMVSVIQRSANRMSDLINDVLDFARGRLGGGLTVDYAAATNIEPVLRQIIAELQATRPDRTINDHLSLNQAFACDHQRIGQLFSNLLANALTHGAADQPIRVHAWTSDDVFQLTVANSGDPIPQAALARLFQPFARGAVRPSQQGLGLGLYIASEIARVHGGTLDAQSSPQETRFTFRMPLAAATPATRLKSLP